jgi:hypothetical protein
MATETEKITSSMWIEHAAIACMVLVIIADGLSLHTHISGAMSKQLAIGFSAACVGFETYSMWESKRIQEHRSRFGRGVCIAIAVGYMLWQLLFTR